MTQSPDGPLCRLQDLDDPGSLTVQRDGVNILVIRRGDQVFGYVNSCPHVGVPLDLEPGQVLDITRTLIQCSLHGALFTMERGLCLSGPCAGKSLRPYPLTLSDGAILPGLGALKS